jgi:signal transduction histidine kinase
VTAEISNLPDDPTADVRVRLEELVDREALAELCQSFQSLFGIGVRIYSQENLLLADATSEQQLCQYVGTTSEGRKLCASTVGIAKSKVPGAAGDELHPCFTGAAYRIIAIEYDGRRVGRMVIGPFLPANVRDAPQSLITVDNAINAERAKDLLLKMPRAKDETVTRMARYLKNALDLILFSGHKALLTGQMHLASVRESFRELEEKNRKLQEAYDRLKELDRLKSNFLATVSHELRTPLTSIIGYSEMLTEGLAGPLVGEQAEFVKTIHEKGEQLLALIMSLLDLGKLESGTMAMRRRTMQIGSVLGEVISTLAPNARKKGVELKLDGGDGGLVELRGDPERLRQVFINLCDNAIKFTPAGGTVTLAAQRAELPPDDPSDSGEGFALLAPTRLGVEVRVIDTGIGIPPREKGRVFDPFYQVDSSSTREYGGTGLGLSIVKRLVEAHGGTICIEDNEPQGAIFVVSIPSAPALRPSKRPSLRP